MFKHLIIVLLPLVFTASAYAQNSNNYIQVISNTSLNWDINTVNEVQNDKTISGAVTLQVKNRSNPGPRSVNARVSNFTTPSGFSAPFMPLKVDYTSDNSPNESNLITTALALTTTSQRLFTHAKHSNNTVYSFNYNLILTETNWDFPPGTYNYTITFNFDYP